MGSTLAPRARLERLLSRCRETVLPPVEEDGEAAAKLIEALDASTRFRRDGRLGRIFHPGKVSYRELSPTNSLHVIVGGGRISAHLDDVSPLRCNPDGSAHYSWVPVVRHNIAGMLADAGRRSRGLHGQERCNLECETVWVDDQGIAGLVAAAGSPPPAQTCCDDDHP